MKIGDRVRIKTPGVKSFDGKLGTIVASMLPDYDWAVLIDGTEDPDDSYGFGKSELELATDEPD